MSRPLASPALFFQKVRWRLGRFRLRERLKSGDGCNSCGRYGGRISVSCALASLGRIAAKSREPLRRV